MPTVHLSLGSNLGDRMDHLRRAVEHLRDAARPHADRYGDGRQIRLFAFHQHDSPRALHFTCTRCG